MSLTSPTIDPTFHETTAITPDPVAPGRFHAHYDERWASLRGIHGGYQTAIAVRAAEAMSPGRSVRTVSASFLRPGAIGPVVLDATVVRSTRTFTTVLVTVSQLDRPVLTVRTTANEAVQGHDWSTPPADGPGPLADAVSFTPPPEVPHFQQAELLLDPSTIPTADADEARIAGYVRPKEGNVLDTAWLVMVGDWFPPSPFRRVAIPIGGVSVDYTVHVHRTVTLGADEWLAAVFTTPTSTGGLALEHGLVTTMDGRAVADTFHTRWTG